MGANYGEASRGTERGMDVRRIEEEVDPDFLSDAHSRTSPVKSGDSYESKVYTKSKEEHESHLKMNLELLKKEKCYVKPNNVEAERREKVIAYTTRQLKIHVENDTTHVMYLDEAVARLGVHVSSIPDRDGMYIEVLARDVEVVRNASRYEIFTFREMSFPTKIVIIRVFNLFSFEALYGRRKCVVHFGKKGELAPRLFARLIEEFGFALHRDVYGQSSKRRLEQILEDMAKHTCSPVRDGSMPERDAKEVKDTLILRYDMPGLDRENVKISVDENTLAIRA
nr:hypothetical protein [Tanacetum cinerariifolium]GEX91667.1 hypothetical protein [Tanacetum cinerariifolium]